MSNNCVDAVLKSINAAEAHIKSEYRHEMAGVMDTVGADPHWAVMPEPGVIRVISGRDGVTALYEASRTAAIPQASRLLTQITSDWYMFVENIPTRLWVPDNSMRTVHTATLLVTGDDGIKGEYVWERQAPAETGKVEETSPLPGGKLRSVTAHETLLSAICEGDGAAIAEVLEPGCIWAQRNYLSDRKDGDILDLKGTPAVAAYFEKWHQAHRPEMVSILNRQATDWYVFAEELWVVRTSDDERRQYRTAVIYPVSASGRIEGAIGYGTNPEHASALHEVCVGQAFWPLPQDGGDGDGVEDKRNLACMAI